MGNYEMVPMTTLKDEGLLSFDECKNKLLHLIQYNLDQFKNNSWDLTNRMNKILTDLDPKKNKTILSLRIGTKRFYRSNFRLLNALEKVEFLSKLYQGVSAGCMDKELQYFCEQQAIDVENRKKKHREERKARRKAEREALKKQEAEALKHLPKNNV